MPGVPDRPRSLHTDIEAAGLPFLLRFVELTTAFHHAVRGEHQDLAATISRLREFTVCGDFAYFVAEESAWGSGHGVRSRSPTG
ncbi:hypothetical protein KPP03845_107423 [Streptomyces xanthophaeus]|nr:hypothetical protein KPP03845_107423 [Streptomyces xanthophaeus]